MMQQRLLGLSLLLAVACGQEVNSDDTSEEDIAELRTKIASLEEQIANQQVLLSKAARLLEVLERTETGDVKLQAPLVVQDADMTIVAGNLTLQNGLGKTECYNDEDSPPNGKGNIILGYNEGFPESYKQRTGSHNLIIGRRHLYTSCGGLVVGDANEIHEDNAVVLGGASGVAKNGGVVIAGQGNTATRNAVVLGGSYNSADRDATVVSGTSNEGFLNHLIVGGHRNKTMETMGEDIVIVGGRENSVAGIADYSVIIGGGDNRIESSGTDDVIESVLIGGQNNRFGYGGGGGASVLVGGRDNRIKGNGSALVGGRENTIVGNGSSIFGTIGLKEYEDDHILPECTCN